jgi:hypothetical protein
MCIQRQAGYRRCRGCIGDSSLLAMVVWLHTSAYVSIRQHTSAYAAEDVAEIPKFRSVGDGGVAELPVCVCVVVFRFFCLFLFSEQRHTDTCMQKCTRDTAGGSGKRCECVCMRVTLLHILVIVRRREAI